MRLLHHTSQMWRVLEKLADLSDFLELLGSQLRLLRLYPFLARIVTSIPQALVFDLSYAT